MIIVLVRHSPSLVHASRRIMGLQNISIVLLLKYLILFDKGFAEDVRTAFERAGIVPNILPVGPEMKLTVSFTSTRKDKI